MTIAFHLEPLGESAPAVAFRWDPDTDILCAHVDAPRGGTEPARSVELSGADGSWLVLDVEGERLAGLEVAIWPEVITRSCLLPPAEPVDGRLTLRAEASEAGASRDDAEIPLTAESDEAEAVIYFRVGAGRAASTVRVGRDLLVDLDRQHRIAGFWLLNVPPFPSS